MADVKISALPAATTPLDGTEVLPIVQSSTTKQVAVSNLTAGRAISASSLTLTTPLGVASGGTGLISLTAGYIPFGAGTSAFGNDSGLFWDNTNKYLGLGTASPSAPLHIYASSASYKLEASTGTGGAFANFINTSGNFYVGVDNSTGGNFGLGNYTRSFVSTGAYDIAFKLNGTERMRLDASGNLGLGVTPSAWRSDFKTMQIGVGGAWWGRTGSVQTGIAANVYMNSSGNWIRLNDGGATTYISDGSTQTWSVASSSTAGTTASFTQAMTLDASGNLGIGTSSPSARVHSSGNSSAGYVANYFENIASNGYVRLDLRIGSSGGSGSASIKYAPGVFMQIGPDANDTTSPLVFATNNATERARIDSSGNLLVGTTSTSAYLDGMFNVAQTSGNPGICAKLSTGASVDQFCYSAWTPFTTGDNKFFYFLTETSGTIRGSITYNRSGGLTAYNTTSDYRAKEVYGPLEGSGEIIDALKVYRGKMHDATDERPLLIAHEAKQVTPYVVTGEKDAVNSDGTPIYQQIDHSAFVPLLIAEVQSIRNRLASLEVANG